jgi:dihydropteroate synthase
MIPNYRLPTVPETIAVLQIWYVLIHRAVGFQAAEIFPICQIFTMADTSLQSIDNALSQRHIDLDPGGYFIIYLDREAQLICAKHFGNTIDKRGLAVDPATGKVIPAKGKVNRPAETIYTGRTAKEICVALFETGSCPVTMFDHAAYLGRELQRAEACLVNQAEYVQD